MIIERVDETRLMIVLAREDMLEYDLSFAQLDWYDRHSRKAIKELLALAREQTGFTTEGKRMMIEAAPGGDGCLILVTLLHAGSDSRRKVYKIKRPCSVFVFEFDTAEDLLSAVERLYAGHQYPSSAVLLLFDGKYRLVILSKSGLSAAADALFSEYGRLVGKGPSAQAAALEHGTLLLTGDVIKEIGSRMKQSG